MAVVTFRKGGTDAAKDSDLLVPVKLAAIRLGRTSRRLREMIRDGDIPAVVDGGRLYVFESTIQQYMGTLPPAIKESDQ